MDTTYHVPTVTLDDLHTFHQRHFSQQCSHSFTTTYLPHRHLPPPSHSHDSANDVPPLHQSQFIASRAAENELPIETEEEVDDQLGYYEDGVKRTLTDAQIAMFRHSEIHAILRRRQQEEELQAEGRHLTDSDLIDHQHGSRTGTLDDEKMKDGGDECETEEEDEEGYLRFLKEESEEMRNSKRSFEGLSRDKRKKGEREGVEGETVSLCYDDDEDQNKGIREGDGHSGAGPAKKEQSGRALLNLAPDGRKRIVYDDISNDQEAAPSLNRKKEEEIEQIKTKRVFLWPQIGVRQ